MKRLIQIAGFLFVAMTIMFIVAERCGWLSEGAVRGFTENASRPVAALVLWLLLAGDLFLPVPSSIVMTLCGAVCGFLGGFAVSLSAAVFSAGLGYGLCRWKGREMFRRLIQSEAESIRAKDWIERYGAWGVVLSRGIPMLTEVISCLCGLAGMHPGRFAGLTLLGTVPVCAVYAYAGSRGETLGFGTALLAAFVIPGLGFAVLHLCKTTK